MKANISEDVLNSNVEHLNEFLSKKGMSMIIGGSMGSWGNSNYAESTRPRRALR